MKFLYEHSETEAKLKHWAGDMKLVLAQFFFWRPGQTLQHAMEGLKRSLLYSILRQCPELIPKLCEKRFHETASLIFARLMPKMDVDEISTAFKDLMSTPKMFEDHKFVFFIDGLDEFKPQGHRQTHNTLVQHILRWCSSHSGRLKICVSSREEPAFEDGFSDHLRLRLQDLTRPDINRTVSDFFEQNDYVKKLQIDQCHISEFASDVVNKSEGVSLWVALVLRNLEIGVINGDHFDDLKNSLSVLPVELEDLIQGLSDRMPNPQHGLRLINLVAGLQSDQGGPWGRTLPELLFIEAVITGRGLPSVEKRLSHEMGLLDRLCMIRKELHSLSSRIKSRCAGLLTICEEATKFLAKDFERTSQEDIVETFGQQEKSELFLSAVAVNHRSIHEYLQSAKSDHLMQSDFDCSEIVQVLLKCLTCYARLVTTGKFPRLAFEETPSVLKRVIIAPPDWHWHLHTDMAYLARRTTKLPSPGFAELMDEFDRALALNVENSGRVPPGSAEYRGVSYGFQFDLYACMSAAGAHEYFREILATEASENNRLHPELLIFPTGERSSNWNTWLPQERLNMTWEVLQAGGANLSGKTFGGQRACEIILTSMLMPIFNSSESHYLLLSVQQMLTELQFVPLCWLWRGPGVRYKAMTERLTTNHDEHNSSFGSSSVPSFVPVCSWIQANDMFDLESVIMSFLRNSDLVRDEEEGIFLSEITDLLGLVLPGSNGLC